jgi:HCOMODA/2-hydroxy-3-carboxy-muconic semialdehyde decarboxylase
MSGSMHDGAVAPAGRLADAVAEAARVVAGHRLVTCFGHVSARMAADRLLVTPPLDLAEAAADGLVELGLDDDPAACGAPPEAVLHQEIYRSRPEVTAIVRAQPPSGFAVAAALKELRPLHGQGAWLGPTVRVHPGARLVRTRERAIAVAQSLADGRALLLRGNGAVTVGELPDPVAAVQVAAARMWLLEASCRIRLAATALGEPQNLSDDEAADWLAAAPPLVSRLWEHLRG